MTFAHMEDAGWIVLFVLMAVGIAAYAYLQRQQSR